LPELKRIQGGFFILLTNGMYAKLAPNRNAMENNMKLIAEEIIAFEEDNTVAGHFANYNIQVIKMLMWFNWSKMHPMFPGAVGKEQARVCV
tara:strand:- start:1830 stop:2102 length:273 start_codon:yes stop_codon:yes gene_type:complete